MRPTTFTAARAAAIVKAKGSGATNDDAAQRAGIPRRTLYNWLRAGELVGREPYKSFARMFRRAEEIADRRVVEAAARAMGVALDAA